MPRRRGALGRPRSAGPADRAGPRRVPTEGAAAAARSSSRACPCAKRRRPASVVIQDGRVARNTRGRLACVPNKRARALGDPRRAWRPASRPTPRGRRYLIPPARAPPGSPRGATPAPRATPVDGHPYDVMVFDLDGVLYAANNGYMEHVRQNARRFIRDRYGVSDEEAGEIRARAFELANQTVRGLRMLGYEVDQADFMDYCRSGRGCTCARTPRSSRRFARCPSGTGRVAAGTARSGGDRTRRPRAWSSPTRRRSARGWRCVASDWTEHSTPCTAPTSWAPRRPSPRRRPSRPC